MSRPLEGRIRDSRKLLGNQYAYLDGDDGYSATEAASDARILQSRILMEDPYAYLDGEGGYSGASSAASGNDLRINVDDIRSPGLVGKRVSFEKIEQIARALQIAIWAKREDLLEHAALDDPVSVLNPEIAFQAIGYGFEVSDSLGQIMTSQGPADCAGFIDKPSRYAGVSSQLPLPVRNFTAAHELGHALLHKAVGMHRDRALDGGSLSGPRDRAEVEADKFATFFLMPGKLLRSEFQRRFLTEQFTVSDDSAFALINDSQHMLRRECGSLRKLARKLADADSYSGMHFESLSRRFGVSTETMAIRLEELELVRF